MKNEQETWRDVWDETCAAMANLEQCIDTVLEVERAVLKEQRARICSEGVAKALALMTECVRQCARKCVLQTSTYISRDRARG